MSYPTVLETIISITGVKKLNSEKFFELLDNNLTVSSQKLFHIVMVNMTLVNGFNKLFLCKHENYEDMRSPISAYVSSINQFLKNHNIGMEFIVIENYDILVNVNSQLLNDFIETL